MADQRRIEEDFALAYSQKFWDAGNLIVTMMFALAFAVYASFIQVCETRIYAHDHYCFLINLSIVSNVLLAWLIDRLYRHEVEIVRSFDRGRLLFHALWAARNIRWGVLAFNTLLYLGVIIFIGTINPTCPADGSHMSPAAAAPAT